MFQITHCVNELHIKQHYTFKPVLSSHLKEDQKTVTGDRLMQVKSIAEHSAILSTCIKQPPVFKTFVLSIFEWPLKTGFTVSGMPQ